MASPTKPAPPTPLGPTEPPPGPDWHSWRLVLVVGIIVVAVLAALSISLIGSDRDTQPRDAASDSTVVAPTQPNTAATTPTTVDPEQALRNDVEAGYSAAAQAFFEAAAIPDPNYPGLAATHTGPMLDVRRGLMIALVGDGRIMRLPPNSQYRNDFESIEFPPEHNRTVAILTVCGVDDREVVDAATGNVITAGPGTVESRAAMRLEDGVWKLAEREELGRWPGVAGCAA